MTIHHGGAERAEGAHGTRIEGLERAQVGRWMLHRVPSPWDAFPHPGTPSHTPRSHANPLAPRAGALAPRSHAGAWEREKSVGARDERPTRERGNERNGRAREQESIFFTTKSTKSTKSCSNRIHSPSCSSCSSWCILVPLQRDCRSVSPGC